MPGAYKVKKGIGPPGTGVAENLGSLEKQLVLLTKGASPSLFFNIGLSERPEIDIRCLP